MRVTGPLKQIIDAPDLTALRAVDGRDIVAGALRASSDTHTLSGAVREDYLTSCE